MEASCSILNEGNVENLKKDTLKTHLVAARKEIKKAIPEFTDGGVNRLSINGTTVKFDVQYTFSRQVDKKDGAIITKFITQKMKKTVKNLKIDTTVNHAFIKKGVYYDVTANKFNGTFTAFISYTGDLI